MSDIRDAIAAAVGEPGSEDKQPCASGSVNNDSSPHAFDSACTTAWQDVDAEPIGR